jgi:ABC-type multidrug transport system fused ATPase/permease subunit
VLTAVGVTLYGLLNIGYTAFYQQFGVSPYDVGLGYTNTLARSTGLVLILLLAILFALVSYIIASVTRQTLVLRHLPAARRRQLLEDLETAQALQAEAAEALERRRADAMARRESNTKENESSWIFEPRLTCTNALRRVQNPGFSLVRGYSRCLRLLRKKPRPLRACFIPVPDSGA